MKIGSGADFYRSADGKRCCANAQCREGWRIFLKTKSDSFARDIAEEVILADDFSRVSILAEPLPPIGVSCDAGGPKTEFFGGKFDFLEKCGEIVHRFIDRGFFLR